MRSDDFAAMAASALQRAARDRDQQSGCTRTSAGQHDQASALVFEPSRAKDRGVGANAAESSWHRKFLLSIRDAPFGFFSHCGGQDATHSK
jgi:hypothetical protein